MTGILPDRIDVNAPPRPRQPYVNDPGVDKFILAAIEETKRCRDLEAQRAQLARHIDGTFDGELRTATDRALGKNYPHNTVRAYKNEFSKFREWCVAEGFSSLPSIPEAVAYYLLVRAGDGAKPAVLERAVSAIRYAHVLFDHSGHRLMAHHCDFNAPVIAAVLSRTRKRWAEEQEKGDADGDNPE
jgi:hypothetical protein